MNLPNKITLTRIFSLPVIMVLYLVDIPYGIGVFCALFVYILASLTDKLDGYIAKKYNLITDFGKFMDQIADKFLSTAVLIMVLFSDVLPYTWLAVLILIIIVSRDTLISGIRLVAANKGVVIAADNVARVKSAVLDVAQGFLIFFVGLRACLADGAQTIMFGNVTIELFNYIGWALLFIGTILSIVSCVNYIINAKPLLKNTDDNPSEKKETK